MGSFFFSDENEAIPIVNKWAIRREGFLYKKSRHLQQWRERWVVIHKNMIYTFVNKNIYTNPTEEINLTEFTHITSPKYNRNISKYIIILSSTDTTFTFSDDSKELIFIWYNEINNSIAANNNNLLCTMLPSEIIIGPISSYIIGYKRFKILSLINKYFAELFNINKFDFPCV
eukprot:30829_1